MARSRSPSSSSSRSRPRVRRRRAARQARAFSRDPRGRRFTPEQHAEALRLIAGGMEREAVAEHIGTTTESLRRWVQGATAAGTMPPAVAGAVSAATATTSAPPVASPPSSAPKDPGAGLGEHETKAILDYKKKHPSMGPAQIRAQLKRFLGWRVSVKAIARVLRQAGFPPVHRKGRPDVERRSLLAALVTPSWLDPATRGPRA